MAMANQITCFPMDHSVQTAIWYLSGATITSGVFGPTLADGYFLTGASRLQRGRQARLCPGEPGTRRTAIWYLNNNVFTGGAFGPTLPAGWSLFAPFAGTRTPATGKWDY